MEMYNVFDQAEQNEKLRKRLRIIFIAALLFFVIAVVELVMILTSPAFQSASGSVLQNRIEDCLTGWRASSNDIAATTNSKTGSKVGTIKGYIYAIDQLTLISYDGKKSKRPAELQDVIDKLYNDIAEFDGVIQQSKSTLDVMKNLNEHFDALEELLRQYDLIHY